MRNLIGVVVLVAMVSGALTLAGCGKKEPAPQKVAVAGKNAHQLLLEGAVFLKQGDVMKAVESFATAIKEDPKYLEGYFMLAQTFLRLQEYRQAQAVLSTASKQFPENPTVYYLLAVAYQGSGDMMPAIISARRSLDLFKAAGSGDGEQRATVFLARLIQTAKMQSEEKMVDGAAQAAAQAVPAGK